MDAWQEEASSREKKKLQKLIALYLGWPDLRADTGPIERKFNIWHFHDQRRGAREPHTRDVRLVYPSPAEARFVGRIAPAPGDSPQVGARAVECRPMECPDPLVGLGGIAGLAQRKRHAFLADGVQEVVVYVVWCFNPRLRYAAERSNGRDGWWRAYTEHWRHRRRTSHESVFLAADLDRAVKHHESFVAASAARVVHSLHHRAAHRNGRRTA